MRRWPLSVLLGIAVAGAWVASARAGIGPGPAIPPRPPDRVVILDQAGMISGSDREEMQNTIDLTLRETAIPIVVVTIRSLGSYGAGHLSIEEYARRLFDAWGIGHKTVLVGDREVPRNLGVLLLVAKGDRLARIELGADWGHGKDGQCRTIMQDHIIAAFKRNEFSAGILAGVKALSAMVREQELPAPPRPAWHYLAWAAFVGLGLFTMVSLIRRGANGWAWLFWGVVFAILGTILYAMTRARSSGGGFSGGSFGGGFSGGGGATGSW
jgi:uncharacterized protein